MTDSDSQDVGYAVNRKIKTQSHMRKVSVYEEDKIRWFRCPRRDDYRGGCRTGWRSQTVWRDSESRRVDSELIKRLEPMEELRFCYEAGPTGYVVYWQLTAWERVRSGGTYAGACEERGARKNRQARCAKVGAELSSRRTNAGVGTGRRSRRATGSAR